MLNIQVDRMAPDGLKGSYFGAAALSGLGFGVGPFVGGALLQYVGGPWTFTITAVTVGACALCYWWSGHVRGPELSGEANAAGEAPRGSGEPRLEISMDRVRLNLDLVHSHLNTTYWAKGRARDVVERSMRHSLCFGAYVEGEQVGFARVVSDRAVFAYLMDVFIPEHQGQGIGKALVGAVVAHPDLRGLRLFVLRTRDAHGTHGLYRQFGFERLGNPEWTMAIQGPEA
jgi:GNAT superfamily N-acetyltransferase